MKLSLDLGKLRQANVWLDDLPATDFESEGTAEISVPATSLSQTQRRAAIEVLAAHCEVSSNQGIFGHLTISLLRLLSLEDSRPVEVEIVKIFSEGLANALT